MIGLLATTAALLYCFVWLRPPEVAGVAFPLQRVLAWAGLAVLLSRLVLKGRPLKAGPAAQNSLFPSSSSSASSSCCWCAAGLRCQNFHVLYFAMDLSKYAAAFAVAYLCYYALAMRLDSSQRRSWGLSSPASWPLCSWTSFWPCISGAFGPRPPLLRPRLEEPSGSGPRRSFLPRLAGHD